MNKFAIAFLIITGFAGALHAAEPINAIIAVINDSPVTRLELDRETKRLLQTNQGYSEDDLRQKALDEIIDRKLQLQQARRLGVAVSDSMLNQRLAELRQEFNLPDEEALERTARTRFFMSYPEFRERVREDLQIQIVFYREVFSRTETYEDEIDQFLRLESDIADTRSYHLQHILIKTADDGSDLDDKRDLALSVQARANAGEDFAALARAYSDDKSAKHGGHIGFKTEKELPDAFIAEVQNLRNGEISGIIATGRGFHLLKLQEARGGNLRSNIRQILLSHIFLPTDAESQARSIWQNISSREDFIAAVEQYSIDNESIEKNGEIGWFDEQDIPPDFSETVSRMQKGDISPPVRSSFGWHILYISDIEEQSLNMQALRAQARRVLRERRALAQRDVWLRRLRGEAHLRLLDPEFQSFQ